MARGKLFDNLFEIKGIGTLLLSPWALRLVRIAALALLLVMAAYGWHQHAIPGVGAKDPLMYTNLATYFFWVLWIMGVVFIALFMGRGWCAVCPLGWLNGLFSNIGLKLRLPKTLDNFIPVTLTLLVLQLFVYFFAIHRYPDYTASLLALMILFAVIAGLIFRKRAFCSLLCPAGAVFSLYARVAPFELRVKDSGVCDACESKACVSGEEIWKRFSLGSAVLFLRRHRPDCPVDLVPAEIDDSATCSLCLHCARNCPNANIRMGSRPWMEDLAKAPLSATETLFLVVLLGLLTTNFSKVYVDLRTLIFWIPQKAALALGWEEAGFYLIATPWVTLALPLLLLLPGYLVFRLSAMTVATVDHEIPPPSPPVEAPSQVGFWSDLGRLTLPFIPLLMAVHAVLALVKLNAKGGFLSYVLLDPSGVQSYLAMNVMRTVPPPGILIPLDILKWIALIVLAAGYLFSLWGARRVSRGYIAGSSRRGYFAASVTGLSLFATLYGATLIRWLFVR